VLFYTRWIQERMLEDQCRLHEEVVKTRLHAATRFLALALRPTLFSLTNMKAQYGRSSFKQAIHHTVPYRALNNDMLTHLVVHYKSALGSIHSGTLRVALVTCTVISSHVLLYRTSSGSESRLTICTRKSVCNQC